MCAVNYYERHLGDYAKQTGHLSMLQHGAYTLLLDRYYGSEKGIPASKVYAVAKATTKPGRAAVDSVLEEFFKLVDGLWIKNRCEEELERARARIETARQNGRHGGRPKKQEQKPGGFSVGGNTETQQEPNGLSAEEPGGLFLGSENKTQTKALQSPHPILQAPDSGVEPDISPPSESSQRLLAQSTRAKPKRRERKTSGLNGHAEGFAQIQAAYPKRAGGQRWQDAAGAYNARLREGRTHEEILAGIERYARHIRDKGEEGSQFVQQAATFLGKNRQFLEPWTAAPTKAEQRLNTNLSAAAEFMRRTEKSP